MQAPAQAGLIVPWEIKIRDGDKDVPVKGFHRIDEAALNALDDAAFLKLRAAGALALAYGQLISMHQLATLSRLIAFRQHLEKARSKSKLDKLTREQVNEMFQLDDDTIRFKDGSSPSGETHQTVPRCRCRSGPVGLAALDGPTGIAASLDGSSPQGETRQSPPGQRACVTPNPPGACAPRQRETRSGFRLRPMPRYRCATAAIHQS